MLKTLKAATWLVWAAITGVTVYSAYGIIQSSRDAHYRWGWLVFAIAIIATISLIAYLVQTAGEKNE